MFYENNDSSSQDFKAVERASGDKVYVIWFTAEIALTKDQEIRLGGQNGEPIIRDVVPKVVNNLPEDDVVLTVSGKSVPVAFMPPSNPCADWEWKRFPEGLDTDPGKQFEVSDSSNSVHGTITVALSDNQEKELFDLFALAMESAMFPRLQSTSSEFYRYADFQEWFVREILYKFIGDGRDFDVDGVTLRLRASTPNPLVQFAWIEPEKYKLISLFSVRQSWVPGDM